MKSFIIILFIIIISILILYIINNNSIENFTDIYSATPSLSGNQWGNYYGQYNQNSQNSQNIETEETVNDIKNITNYNHNCEVGNTCLTENGYGTLNKNCICVLNSNINIAEEENINENENEKLIPVNKSNIFEQDLTNCYPNNTNFDSICKNINSTYGVKKIIKCDSNNSKVECSKNYINGNFLGNMVTITPCLNKTDDFNTWCRYYNNNPIPSGYNVNSIGAKNILVGKEGDCYFENGIPDNHSARAVCDYNHNDEVYKLESANNKIDYNLFTDCYPLKPTNFVKKCSELLDIPYEHTFADQIMGYDCNPGFGRAKCIASKDIDNYTKSQYDESTFGIKTYINNKNQIQDQVQNNCNCDTNNS
jgi:hypothetical protein